MRTALTIINATGAIMHFLFGMYISHHYTGEYRSFLLMENAMIAFYFIFLALTNFLSAFKGRSILYNLIFWSVFEVCILILRPEKTTLEILQWESLNQWITLSVLGAITILLCLITHFKIFRFSKQSLYGSNYRGY